MANTVLSHVHLDELRHYIPMSTCASIVFVMIYKGMDGGFCFSRLRCTNNFTEKSTKNDCLLQQWPSAKILGVSELGLEVRDGRIVSSGRLCPSDAMNSIRRELSDLP